MNQTPVLLCMDAGNTLVKWCLFDNLQQNFSNAMNFSSQPTSELKPFENACTVLGDLLSSVLSDLDNPVAAVLLCNVLGPDFERAVRRLCEQHHVPLHVLSVNTKVPMRSAYENPSQLGKDRWAACLAVSQNSHAQVNLLVSFGTATTVDAVVDQAGWQHLGGFIVPGLHTMFDSLHVNTAELPPVRLGVPASHLDSGFWPGTTQRAIGEGVGRMQAAFVQSLVNQLAHQYEQTPVVWFSGGFAHQMVMYFPQAHLLEHAVFKGLVFDYQCSVQGRS
ncbi:type III pantothenate kinase [Limnobacter thiooxidans]|uniref:Type III pantothenate kinase n=1 Tax=Limnobacter thiooxidans TaxID=131080 RepID=A0AA86J914_9BURK|nr:type III pantothenate kinase [Limnobacter sp.]MCZ8015965.1 type III pantothenate kinase [Limnobacter sp.]RZS40201.1 type III pantothenate kinase [Limnobacter thiooxidans]BET27365.1 type III pantothenate kinase [Limnobacter thiooxidans]